MTTDDPVHRALANLAAADRSRHAPAHLERAVLEAFDRQSDRAHLRWTAVAARDFWRETLAMAVATALVATLWHRAPDRVVPSPHAPERQVPS